MKHKKTQKKSDGSTSSSKDDKEDGENEEEDEEDLDQEDRTSLHNGGHDEDSQDGAHARLHGDPRCQGQRLPVVADGSSSTTEEGRGGVDIDNEEIDVVSDDDTPIRHVMRISNH